MTTKKNVTLSIVGVIIIILIISLALSWLMSHDFSSTRTLFPDSLTIPSLEFEVPEEHMEVSEERFEQIPEFADEIGEEFPRNTPMIVPESPPESSIMVSESSPPSSSIIDSVPKPPEQPDVYWSELNQLLLELEQKRTAVITMMAPQSSAQTVESMTIHTQEQTLLDWLSSKSPQIASPPSISELKEKSWAMVGKQVVELEQQREKTITSFGVKMNNPEDLLHNP